MKIGEKIKMLRTAKFMSQSELAGSEITRNMLSCIENGSAQPSLNTARYIASRLNVPLGYLLAEGEEEAVYLKYSEMANIKRAYVAGDYRICRDMCLGSRSLDDDEVALILAECQLAIAKEEFNGGRLRSACEYFDEAIEACEKTLYRTEGILAEIGAFFKYMKAVSQTLSSNVIDEDGIETAPSLTDEFCRYIAVFCDGKPDAETLSVNKPYRLHIDARGEMAKEDYRSAYEKLHSILVAQDVIPEPMLYFVFCDLEICCRELGNYKGAYEYSNSKMTLIQNMLS